MGENPTGLYGRLSKLQRLLGRHHLLSQAEGGPFADATRGQGRILAALKQHSGISTKDLSQLLGIRVSSLNELLIKLERGGFIERRPSDSDRRIMLIHLTEKGRKTQHTEGNHSGIFDCLNADEQRAFGEYLDRVTAALEEKVGHDRKDGSKGHRGYSEN